MEARELDGAQRAELQQLLARRETELQEAILLLRRAIAPAVVGGKEVRDSVEEGDARMMTSVDLVQLQRHEEELRDVRHARDRSRQGGYGRCEECDEPIPFGRLKARPAARFCLQHEEAWEKAHPGAAVPS